LKLDFGERAADSCMNSAQELDFIPVGAGSASIEQGVEEISFRQIRQPSWRPPSLPTCWCREIGWQNPWRLAKVIALDWMYIQFMTYKILWMDNA